MDLDLIIKISIVWQGLQFVGKELTYDELITFDTFDDRFNYLKLHGNVGIPTFGHERWINQRFYQSKEWRDIRNYVITRDNGCDLGCEDHPIAGKIMVHHMVPLSVDSLEHSDKTILDPNYLISCSIITHNAIHFGNKIENDIHERFPNDTCPWRQ